MMTDSCMQERKYTLMGTSLGAKGLQISSNTPETSDISADIGA